MSNNNEYDHIVTGEDFRLVEVGNLSMDDYVLSINRNYMPFMLEKQLSNYYDDISSAIFLSNYLDKTVGGSISGYLDILGPTFISGSMNVDGNTSISGDLSIDSHNFAILSGNYVQTPTPNIIQVYGKNSFAQVESISGYSPASVGSKGFYILRIISSENKVFLSNDTESISDYIPESCYSESWSIALDNKLDAQFSQISAIDGNYVIFKDPFKSIASFDIKDTDYFIDLISSSNDNALYCPTNPNVGNVNIPIFSSNHIEGGSTHAIAQYAHAEGRGTYAEGRYSHAEGHQTSAAGTAAHAEGMYSKVLNNYGSHAEGYYTLATGEYGSHSEGEKTVAEGRAAHAEGLSSLASGDYSHAEGYAVSAMYEGAHAEGQKSQSNGEASHAEGRATIAVGKFSHAEGGHYIDRTYYPGGYALGNGSHAEGVQTSAIGIGSHAEGHQTVAIGDYSHAEGLSTLAEGYYAHAEGGQNDVNGINAGGWAKSGAHAEGVQTSAFATGSHAEGKKTYANAFASHAEGWQTSAEGEYSYAGGYKSKAIENNQFVWNGAGTEAGAPYIGKGGKGTFNINPREEISGFYIGSQDLGTLLNRCLLSSEISAAYVNQHIYLSAKGQLVGNIDCAAFIKDGMLSNVELCDNQLIFSFNTDASTSPISIDLSNFIDETQYYTKSQTSSFSELSLAFLSKQDDLDDAQMSAINSIVDERATVIDFGDGDISTFNWVGGIDINAMISVGLYNPTTYSWTKQPKSVKVGTAVSSIGHETFTMCNELTNVSLPNSIIEIGQLAFYGCTELKKIFLPNSITSIGESSFRYLGGEHVNTTTFKVDIPDSVISIGSDVFMHSAGISSIIIGNNVSSIGSNSFQQCPNLTKVVFKDKTIDQIRSMENYPWGIAEDNLSVIMAWNDASQEWVVEQLSAIGTVLDMVETYVIFDDNSISSFDWRGPLNSQTLIKFGLYDGSSSSWIRPIKEIRFGSGVTQIESTTFAFCNSLVAITIPSTVTSIGYGAFLLCNNLNKIFIKEGLVNLGNRVFGQCSSLTNVSLPNTLISIGSQTFSYCTSLTTILIPDSVESIGADAFTNCDALQNVVIGNNTITIGNNIFYGCHNLNNVVLGPSIQNIGSLAFSHCGLTEINIPNSVKTIGSLAFSECDNLDKVIFNGKFSNDVLSMDNYPWGIDESKIFVHNLQNVVNDNSGYTVVKYNNELQETSSFYIEGELSNSSIPNLSNAIDVKIGNKVTNIGSYAFYKCINLSNIVIPSSIISIGIGAFEHCSSLINITIPDSVKDIGYYAFSDCSSLIDVTIGNSISVIPDGAFENCINLTNVTIPNTVYSIGYRAFDYCINLSNISIPNSVISIEQETFLGCSSLINVIIPDSVIYFGQGVFYSCSSLTNIKLPSNINIIESYTFYRCSSLSSITIPNSVLSIGLRAFAYCNSLSNIIIPSNVNNIESLAFAENINMTNVIFEGKTFTEVSSTYRYPWGLLNTDVIKTYAFESH